MDNIYQIQRLKEVIDKMYETLDLIHECKEEIETRKQRIIGAEDRMKKLSMEYSKLHKTIFEDEASEK